MASSILDSQNVLQLVNVQLFMKEQMYFAHVGKSTDCGTSITMK